MPCLGIKLPRLLFNVLRKLARMPHSSNECYSEACRQSKDSALSFCPEQVFGQLGKTMRYVLAGLFGRCYNLFHERR